MLPRQNDTWKAGKAQGGLGARDTRQMVIIDPIETSGKKLLAQISHNE